jgi:periplasmic mercuric ion binding protein
MKRHILLILLALAFGLEATAQRKAQDTLHVDGVCGMCKERIEKALDVPGVWVAEWDKETKKLYVVYRPKKISLERISELLNEVGHDTALSKASDDAYSNIHGCCTYREESTIESHQAPHK